MKFNIYFKLSLFNWIWIAVKCCLSWTKEFSTFCQMFIITFICVQIYLSQRHVFVEAYVSSIQELLCLSWSSKDPHPIFQIFQIWSNAAYIHFDSVFNLQYRTRQYFCMHFIENACMHKFLQKVYKVLQITVRPNMCYIF